MDTEFPPPDHLTLDDPACIRAELDIAAFIDEVLAPERHQALFEHIMECDLCLQALLECMAERNTRNAVARHARGSGVGSLLCRMPASWHANWAH